MNRAPSSSSLVLVGTVHRDPRGFAKLLEILDKRGPDFITVEISPYALEFRETQVPALRAILRENLRRIQEEDGESYRALLSHSEIQGIFHLLRVPFEWRAAEAYAQRRRIDLKAIDLSAYSEEKLAQISELIQPDNLRALLRSRRPSIAIQVEWQYQRARILWDHPQATGSTFLQGAAEREAHMAGEIRMLMEEGEKKTVLHVGGWEHLVEFRQEKSLFTRLANFNPSRLLLANLA